MTLVKRSGVLVTAMALAGGICILAGCRDEKVVVPDPQVRLERGRYLVEKIGMCADCHSPRGPGGVFDRARWLQGSPLGFAPTVPMPAWAEHAPAIAGLHNYSDEQAVALLTEGKTLHGQPLRPPMPEFRFNREDASAVVAYLRSLK